MGKGRRWGSRRTDPARIMEDQSSFGLGLITVHFLCRSQWYTQYCTTSPVAGYDGSLSTGPFQRPRDCHNSVTRMRVFKVGSDKCEFAS